MPISIYMIWSNRASLRGIAPEPAPWGGLVIVAFALLWLAAYLSGVAEVAQFAIVGVIEGVCLTIFGFRVYRRLLLPFAYLWLMVPTGEFLLLPLQRFTATAAADMLNWSGIPAFRESFGIEVSNGNYVVAPGCAGLNFVLAAIALSLAFGELEYRRLWRKLAFVAGCLTLAVVGNALRVFLIIAIAHLTNNIGDIVDDHLIYGWGFFALLIFGAMAIGHRFREVAWDGYVAPPRPLGAFALYRAAALAALLAVAVPVAALAGWRQEMPAASVSVPRLSCGAFTPGPAGEQWKNVARHVDAIAALECANGATPVQFGVAVLRRPVREGKIIGLEQGLNDEGWTAMGATLRFATIDGMSVPVRSEVMSSGERQRLVWSAYRVGGIWRRPGVDAVLADLRGDLLGARRATVILVETDVVSDVPSAETALRQFLSQLPVGTMLSGSDPG